MPRKKALPDVFSPIGDQVACTRVSYLTAQLRDIKPKPFFMTIIDEIIRSIQLVEINKLDNMVIAEVIQGSDVVLYLPDIQDRAEMIKYIILASKFIEHNYHADCYQQNSDEYIKKVNSNYTKAIEEALSEFRVLIMDYQDIIVIGDDELRQELSMVNQYINTRLDEKLMTINGSNGHYDELRCHYLHCKERLTIPELTQSIDDLAPIGEHS